MRSRRNRGICGLILAAALFALPSTAQAADYNFETLAPSDYYDSTSYEDVYGSQYNYGGPNVVDYQIPDLEYGILSTTQTGIMEKALLPGLQQTVATNTVGGLFSALPHRERGAPEPAGAGGEAGAAAPLGVLLP